MPMENDWIKVYEETARKFHNPIAQSGYLLNGIPIPEIIFSEWFKYIQQHFQINEQDSILDVGCGSGLFLKYFCKITNKIFGADASQGQLDNAGLICPEAILIKSDALNVHYLNYKFNRIICNSVFMYFPDLTYAKNVLMHFKKISSKDAKIWIGDNSYPSDNEMDKKTFRRRTMSDKMEMQHYPVTFFDNCAKELNLKGKKIDQKIPGKATAINRYDYLFEKL
jgi:cyclopropane fatty-acyl-phospholipid synthase-like methyltransferase